jgi:Na+(H+)/acetate symporter ActP
MATATAILAFPFVGLAGAFLTNRFLGLAIAVGLLAGFALLAILVAPYYRKSGGVTLPDYLAVRFGNPLVRIVAAIVLIAATLPLLAAAMASWRGSPLSSSWRRLPFVVVPSPRSSAGCGRPRSRAAPRRSS